MKRTSLCFLVLIAVFFSLFAPNKVSAQDFNFNKAYQDYQYSYEMYNSVYSEYSKAKDAYLKNSTLTLKEDARKKTLNMLQGRDELQKVYLTMLRMRLLENPGLTNDQKGSLYTKIDTEVSWYLNHKSQYLESDPLENLFGKSSESESRYKTNTSQVVYDSLFSVTLGDLVSLGDRQEKIYRNLRVIIDEQVSSGKIRIDPFNRWFTDIESVSRILKENEESAKIRIQKLYSESYSSPAGTYSSAIEILSQSVNQQKQLNSFLNEVLTSIINQQ